MVIMKSIKDIFDKAILPNKENIIKNPNIFLYAARLLKGHNLKAHHGEYFIEEEDSLQDIINKINEGDVHLRKVTIAEGLSTHSILKTIDEAPYLIGELQNTIEKLSHLYTRSSYPKK